MNTFGLRLTVLATLVFAFGSAVQAGEIIFVEDINQNIITEQDACQSG